MGGGSRRCAGMQPTFHVHDSPVGHLLAVGLLASLLAVAVRLVVGHDHDRDPPVPVEFPQLAPLGRRVYVRLFLPNAISKPRSRITSIAVVESRVDYDVEQNILIIDNDDIQR